MFPRYNVFLAVKVAERVQQLSREKCSGCLSELIIDQLHPCMRISMEKKIEMFLPRAKKEALERLDYIFHIYKQTNCISDADDQMFLEAGENFIQELDPDDLLDRRYINEDSVVEHGPFDISWLTDQIIDKRQTPLPPILPLDFLFMESSICNVFSTYIIFLSIR